MVDVSLLFISVFTLFLFMIPGFILKKSGLADDSFAKALSLFTLYVGQSSMIINGFIIPFDSKVLSGVIKTFILSLIIHTLFFVLAKRMWRKAPERVGKVLRFGVVFSNAGYMGIPVINDVFGQEYVIYATIYIVWFNVFAFSLGRMLYTNDKRFISVKKIFINPAVIPITIGLIIFISGLGGAYREAMLQEGLLGDITTLIYTVIETFKNMVAPASMLVIGAKLADISFKGILKDKYLYPFIATRLLIFPAIVWVVLRLLFAADVIDSTVMSITLILSSTPAAAITTIFAELYDGDSIYSGKLVAITTMLSVITMPTVALLLQI